jgi:hypothetical protein
VVEAAAVVVVVVVVVVEAAAVVVVVEEAVAVAVVAVAAVALVAALSVAQEIRSLLLGGRRWPLSCSAASSLFSLLLSTSRSVCPAKRRCSRAEKP